MNMIYGGSRSEENDDGYILMNSWVKPGVNAEILTSSVGMWGAYPYLNVNLRGGGSRVQYSYIRLGPVDLTKYQQIESQQTTYFATSGGSGSTITALFVSKSADARSYDQDSIADIGTHSSGAVSDVMRTLDVSDLRGEYYIYVGTDSTGASWTNSRCVYPYTCRLLDAEAVAAQNNS